MVAQGDAPNHTVGDIAVQPRDSSEVRYTSLSGLLPVLRYEWRMRKAWHSRCAAARGLWWTLARRYPNEICENCGRPVGASTGFTWWRAPDALWMAVNGSYGGTVCIPCFTQAAAKRGLGLYWTPVLRGDGQESPDA